MKEKILNYYKGNKDAETCINFIEQALKESGVYSDLALVGCVATVRVECGKGFKSLSENLNYRADMLVRMWPRYFPTLAIANEFAFQPEKIANRAYGNRMANGNEASGDGWKYRGRGYIQITGKANYIQYGNALGIDLVNNPELAMEPKTAAKVLVSYFKERKCIEACNAKDWLKVRRLINGNVAMPHGYDLFKQVVEQYLAK
jgi:putative chitinase